MRLSSFSLSLYYKIECTEMQGYNFSRTHRNTQKNTHIHKHSQTNLPSTTQTKLEPSFHGFSLHHGLDAANHQDYGSFQNCACAFSEAAVHRDGSPHDKCSGSSNHPSHVKGAVKCVRGGGLCVVCSRLCCGRFLLWCVVC